MGTRQQILKLLQAKRRITSTEVAGHFGFTRQYASQLLSSMAEAREVVKFGSTKSAFYTLSAFVDEVGPRAAKKKLLNRSLKEHEVLEDFVVPFPAFRTAPENVQSILRYAFSEMLNNAIEHSKSKGIEVQIESAPKVIRFAVTDFGIGVFRNVMAQRNLTSAFEAMQDLLKGKTTTEPKAHSGEGIFFTSKAGDRFALESFGYRMVVDNTIPDVFFQETGRGNRGTRVIFTIARNSQRHLNDVFKEYQSEPGNYAFDKTEIRVRLFTMGTIYVSRSQARRVLAGLDKFKKIILDFDGVPNIGQAFADEVFRVFQSRHPNISIAPTNMNEAVRFMVERVEKP